MTFEGGFRWRLRVDFGRRHIRREMKSGWNVEDVLILNHETKFQKNDGSKEYEAGKYFFVLSIPF